MSETRRDITKQVEAEALNGTLHEFEPQVDETTGAQYGSELAGDARNCKHCGKPYSRCQGVKVAQPIPSGQCPTCGSNDKKHHLCTRCRRSYWAHLGHQIDSSLARGQGLESHPFDECSAAWHDQPTPATIGPNTIRTPDGGLAILGITGGSTPAAQPDMPDPPSGNKYVGPIVRDQALIDALCEPMNPVSAEATKPDYDEIAHYQRQCADTRRAFDRLLAVLCEERKHEGRRPCAFCLTCFAPHPNYVVPPVAPPEADGARELQIADDIAYARKHGKNDAWLAVTIAARMAQKEAEISRLTAANTELRTALAKMAQGYRNLAELKLLTGPYAENAKQYADEAERLAKGE